MGSWLTKNKENNLAVIWKDKFTKSADNKSIKILNDIISNSRSQNNLSNIWRPESTYNDGVVKLGIENISGIVPKFSDIFKKGGIFIKPENKGKFTEYCKGKVTTSCIQKGKNSSDPKIRKRATFAANTRKWKHQEGGEINYDISNILKLWKKL